MIHSTRTRTARHRRHASQPRLDALEDRTLPSGFLDPTFGAGGTVFTNFPGSPSSAGVAPLVQPDGKTVVVGSSSISTEVVALARYNADGSLDGSFGNGGRVVQDYFGRFGSDLHIADAVLQADGEIVVAGTDETRGVVTRFNASGTLDTSFGNDGWAFLPNGIGVAGLAMDGNMIVAVGDSFESANNSAFAVVRFDASGNLDPTFGGGQGWVTADLGANDFLYASGVAIQADGKIAVSGTSEPVDSDDDPTGPGVIALARFKADGTLDSSFGTSGLATATFDTTSYVTSTSGVGLQGNNIVVVGSDWNSQGVDSFVARFTSQGNPDPTFGSNGWTTFDSTSNGGRWPAGLAVQTDGSIVVAGTGSQAGTGFDFVVARFTGSGTPDSSFNQSGMATVNFGSQYDIAAGMALQTDANGNTVKIVVAGTTDNDFAVARLNIDGTPDASFNGDGKTTTDFELGADDTALQVATQSDGKLVVLEDSDFTYPPEDVYRLVCYNPDGSLDGNFGGGGQVVIDLGLSDFRPTGIAISPTDGNIIVVGNSTVVGNNCLSVPAGMSMAEFDGGTGTLIWTRPIGAGFASGVAVQADGNILVTGSGSLGPNDVIILDRFSESGSWDTSFGTFGGTVVNLGTNIQVLDMSVSPGPGGTIVVAGGDRNLLPLLVPHVVAVRFTDSGALDITFGSNGVATADLPFTPSSMAVQDDGSVVVAGSTEGALNDFAVARFTNAGALDSTFGSGGMATAPLGSQLYNSTIGVAQYQGKIIVAGTTYQAGTGNDFAVARFTSAGVLDTFNGDGVMTADLAFPDVGANGMAVQADGEVVVAGTSYQGVTGRDVTLARFLGNQQSSPVLSSVTTSADGTTIQVQGTLFSTPNTSFTLSFFADVAPDSSGRGQGQICLGSVTNVQTDASGNASFSATLPTPSAADPYVSATATDSWGNTSNSFSFALPINSSQVVYQTTTDTQVSAAVTAINSSGGSLSAILDLGGATTASTTALNAPSGVQVILTSSSGTATMQNTTVNSGTVYVESSVSPVMWTVNGGTVYVTGNASAGDFTINGGTVYINGSLITGSSPAIIVNGGTVILQGVTARTATNAPTIVVHSGSLVVRNSTIQESTGYAQSAIVITGGTVDLGTTTNPGGNTFDVNGTGTLIQNTTGHPVPAVGDAFENNGVSVPSIFVLNPTASGALTLGGNSSINMPGVVLVESSSTTALSIGGKSQLNASATGVSVPDPLAGLVSPSIAGLTNYGAESLAGNAHATIQPGIYSQITVSGKAGLILDPGIYIIEGGGLTVTGNASISGTGVMIYNAGSNYPNAGGNFGGIALSGNGTFNLSAPTAGAYVGVLIFQSRQNTRALSVSAGALQGMSGTIYAANALLSISGGNAQLQNSLIVGTLSVSGNVSLTQMAAGSDGTGDTFGIANTLLAGNLSVYINDPSNRFTSDELARIQDAISAWDAILAPYHVTITEVSDPTLANLVIDTSTTSACGGAANGVLGCYNESNSEITILQGWSWYAGADPTQIGPGQYDFETTVLHELGHALGLGHSTDPSSPMHGTLAAGVADRDPTTQDLNIPDPPEDADPQMAAGFLLGPAAMPASPNGRAAAPVAVGMPGPAGFLALPSAPAQWSAVSGQCPASGVPMTLPAGPEATLVVQVLDRDPGRDLSWTGLDDGRTFDSVLADLVTDADRSRGADADRTRGDAGLSRAGDAEDGTGPAAIRSHRIDPTGFGRPVGLPVRARPVERGLIPMSAISEAVLDDLSTEVVGWPGRTAVPADPIARPETPPEPGKGLTKLAATLIVAGSWGHRARFGGVASRQAGRIRSWRENAWAWGSP